MLKYSQKSIKIYTSKLKDFPGICFCKTFQGTHVRGQWNLIVLTGTTEYKHQEPSYVQWTIFTYQNTKQLHFITATQYILHAMSHESLNHLWRHWLWQDEQFN